ncbi:DUF4044 domain-containing protein [Clostridium sp. ETTB3]|mgnify:FL=1
MKAKTRQKMIYIVTIFMLVAFIIGLLPAIFIR